MFMRLEARSEPSQKLTYLSPVIAVALTVIIVGFIFLAMGIDPLLGLKTYFITPLAKLSSVYELLVKASPLVLIAVGLIFCFRANIWNIGAEGQYTLGAIFGGWMAVTFHESESMLLLPAVILAGVLGGMLWAAIPALLKIYFRANEILTSLMLTPVAVLLLDYLVRGPLRDPGGYNMPESRSFPDAAILPTLFNSYSFHIGIFISLITAILATVLLYKAMLGYKVDVSGNAPRAARFGGFSSIKMTLIVFLISGACAGLAGTIEVSARTNQLIPTIPLGYGFTAIIVAFLGRRNPIGAVFAGLLLALSYMGGEEVQVKLQVPSDLTGVLQGLLLFLLLGCDTLINHKVSFSSGAVTNES